MKKTLFFILAIAVCISLAAQPYSAKSFKEPVKKAYKTTYGGSTESAFVPSERPSTHVPLGKGEIDEVGETWHIMQTNGAARNTINWSPDGNTCAASWIFSPGASSSGRGTCINYFDNNTYGWEPMPTERIETSEGLYGQPGWGCHVYTEEGECVVAHSDKAGLVVNYREKRGEGEWTQYILEGPENTGPAGRNHGLLWPTMTAVGNTLHLFCVTDGDYLVNDIDYCPVYFKSTDGGLTWGDPKLFTFDEMSERDQFNLRGDDYVITARGEHVVIAYNPGNVAYMESLDGGDTWTYHLVYDFPWDWTTHGELIGPGLFAISVAAAIGDDHKVHIAFTTHMRVRDTDTDPWYYGYWTAFSGMFTWNDEQPVISHKDFGIISEDPEYIDDYSYDTLPFFLDAPGLLGFEQFNFWNPFSVSMISEFVGHNGYINQPRLIASKGKVYLMYNSIIEQPMLHPSYEQFLRGVFLTVSEDNGDTYDQHKNTSWLSYNPSIFFCDWSGYEVDIEGETHNGSIELIAWADSGFPTMATDVQNNTLVFTWLNDIFPFPDDQYASYNAYPVQSLVLKTWEAGKVNNIDSVWRGICNKIEEKEVINNFKIYPNPANDKITVETGTTSQYTLTVSNIMGQVLYSTKGINPIVDIKVANYPSGIYVVNVKTAHATASKKLIIK